MNALQASLPQAALQRLRAGYDRRAFTELARVGAIGGFPPAAGYVDALLEGFFVAGGPLAPDQRELVILALFTGVAPRWMVAVHVYVGLVEGLEVDAIAGAVLLSAIYSRGMAAYTATIRDVTWALGRLAVVAGDPARAPTVEAVLAALREEARP